MTAREPNFPSEGGKQNEARDCEPLGKLPATGVRRFFSKENVDYSDVELRDWGRSIEIQGDQYGVLMIPAAALIALAAFIMIQSSADRASQEVATVEKSEAPVTIPEYAAQAREVYLRFESAETVDEKLRELRWYPELRERVARTAQNPERRLRKFLPGAQTSHVEGASFLFLPVELWNGRIWDVAFELSPSGPRIDWDYLVAYSEIDWEACLASKEASIQAFRVVFVEDNYFNWDFSCPIRFACYRLSHPLEEGVCYAYVELGSANHAVLKQLIKKNSDLGYGNSKAILRLRSQPSERIPKQVMIDAVVSEEWLMGNLKM